MKPALVLAAMFAAFAIVGTVDYQIATALAGAAWMSDHQQDAEAPRAQLAREAGCDALVIRLPPATSRTLSTTTTGSA